MKKQYGNLKYNYGNRSFCCKWNYVDTTEKITKRTAKYIQNQLKEDQLQDQMTMKKYKYPFAGSNQQTLRKWKTICTH